MNELFECPAFLKNRMNELFEYSNISTNIFDSVTSILDLGFVPCELPSQVYDMLSSSSPSAPSTIARARGATR
ncbi:hypothetical protein Y032_0041g413 [Ancylostoma ceylanicum]|uniref:Uncharacterized protein n=1 Tax=Ancylostoma ceylanicum TaxID=53326 RepID=A0A016UH33_9BILA|nr:hypothetical protein Y032_0041g413 [Ancylostoma ceylanicum]